MRCAASLAAVEPEGSTASSTGFSGPRWRSRLHTQIATRSGHSPVCVEVEAARESLSPHLVQIFDVGRSDEEIFLTMEYLSGGSLRDRLRCEKQLEVEEAVRIAESVLKGLAALHATETIHRDVTPGNILFGANGVVKLGDFGLVRREGRDETQLTREGGVVGTAGYLSPEQVQNRKLGPWSDLFSFGVVLFEMLAGRLPQEALSALGYRLAPLQPAPNVRRFQEKTPRWLARIVARLLEVSPHDRYQSAEAVLRDFHRHHAPGRPRLRRGLLRLAVLALLVLPPVGVVVVRTPGPSFSHFVPLGARGIAAIGSHGEQLWKIPWVDPETSDKIALARISPGGPRYIAAVLVPPKVWAPDAVSTLSFLDPATGKVRDRVLLPGGDNYFPDDPPRFAVKKIVALDLFHSGVDEILVSFCHVPEAPSYTVLYEPRLRKAWPIFYGRGHQTFQAAADVDGGGSPELLFAGVNNGWNWVNVVAAVRLDPWRGADWNPAPTTAPDMIAQGPQERSLLWYAVVPRGYFDGWSFLGINEARREITLRYTSGKTWTLGFEGFPKDGSSAATLAARQTARRETYEHLSEAERLRLAGALDLAMAEAHAAQGSAARARSGSGSMRSESRR